MHETHELFVSLTVCYVNPDASNVGASNGILEYSVIEFTTGARDDYPKGSSLILGSTRK